MKKTFRTSFVSWVLAVASAAAVTLPMPPQFDAQRDPEDLLRSYPLGVITQPAAHAHHGHPDHRIDLPNGLEGWVYELHGDGISRKYIQPDGSEQTVREAKKYSLDRSYTLVFDRDRTVIDVLFDDQHRDLGLSAVQVQRRSDVEGQKLPGVPHGPHSPPGASQERY